MRWIFRWICSKICPLAAHSQWLYSCYISSYSTADRYNKYKFYLLPNRMDYYTAWWGGLMDKKQSMVVAIRGAMWKNLSSSNVSFFICNLYHFRIKLSHVFFVVCALCYVCCLQTFFCLIFIDHFLKQFTVRARVK